MPALDRAAYLKSVGLEAGDHSVVVGIAARLNPVKDIATLIRGFAIAYREHPELRLLIAGDGEQMDMLKQLAADLRVASGGVLCRLGQRHGQLLPCAGCKHPHLPVRDLPLCAHRGGTGRASHRGQPALAASPTSLSTALPAFSLSPGMQRPWAAISPPWPPTPPYAPTWAAASMKKPGTTFLWRAP